MTALIDFDSARIDGEHGLLVEGLTVASTEDRVALVGNWRMCAPGMPPRIAPASVPCVGAPPITTSSLMPAAAAARPQASCRSREASPSSSISPSTAMRRPVVGVEASVASIA